MEGIDSILNIPGGLTPQTTPSVPSNTIDQEGFLRLLVAQLQNQDPLEPLNNEEFVQQLTAFSSLDELRGINRQVGDLSSLDRLSEILTASLALQQANVNASAVSLIGQEVEAVADTVSLNGSSDAEIGVILPDPSVRNLSVRLTTPGGQEIYRADIDLGDLPDGARVVGDQLYLRIPTQNQNGEPLPEGAFEIIAETAAGGSAALLQTTLLGAVSGIDFRGETTFITVGGTRVDLANVLAVIRPREEPFE